MPGRKGYVAAAILFLLGLAVAGAFLFLRLRDLGEGIQQVVVPGAAELELDEAGGWTIYHETGATVDGRYYASEVVSGLAVSITDPYGGPVEVRAPGATTSYEMGGRRGRSILGFEADGPGTYVLTGEYPEVGGPQVVLGVAHGFGRDLALTIGGTLALAFGSAGLAAAIAAFTFVRRYRAKRRPPAVPPIGGGGRQLPSRG
ncbi:MAG TPA: hypothetical protein VJ982_01385 [Gemmatimonadota bacterium]|nr:hypothetical protein [Gemmatimonadota bacterium]